MTRANENTMEITLTDLASARNDRCANSARRGAKIICRLEE